MNRIEIIEFLQKIEYMFFDKCNHDTDNLTDDYQKHIYLSIAAKARELNILIDTSQTIQGVITETQG